MRPDAFDRAFAYVVSPDVEGAFSKDPADPGNWTGGRVGAGELRGTKWGISAARYPDEPIEALTLDRCRELYRCDYWEKAACHDLPEGLAFVVFDCAVNQGIGHAARFLQTALGVPADGVIGPATTLAAWHAKPGPAIALFAAERVLDYTRDAGFPHNGRGWIKRAVLTSIEAMS